MKRTLLALPLLVLWLTAAIAADCICPPLISNVNAEALTVSVLMDKEDANLTLTYGSGKSAKPTKIEKTDTQQMKLQVAIHKFRITGLKAGEVVPYEVAGFKSEFRAAPGNVNEEVLFMFGGDYNMPTDAGVKALEEKYKKKVDFFMDLGDHLIGRRIWGKTVEWLGRVPVVIGRGNHDNDEKYTKDQQQLQKHLDFPNHPNMDFTHEWGPVMVRAEDVPGYSKPYPQADLDVIDKAFAGTKCPWKFYICHHVFFSDGPHGFQEFEAGGGKKAFEGVLRREGVWPVFQKHNVKLVFNGHDHMYQRSHAVDGSGKQAANGVVNVTFGGVGKDFKGKSPWSAFQYLGGTATLGYAHVKGDTTTVQLLEPTGKAADEVVVKLK